VAARLATSTYATDRCPRAVAVGVAIGPMWQPQSDGESVLLAVSAAGDRSHLETVTAGPVTNAHLVPIDNNIAQRTFRSGFRSYT
jgi:hypothetical protein